jgi:RimJ/RimL family protein N-acetyltransferase
MTVLMVRDFELRPPVVADLDAQYAMMEPAAMRRFLGPVEPSKADLYARILRTAGSWAVYGYGTFTLWHRPSGALAGSGGIFPTYRGLGDDFDLMPEAGWIIAQDFWGCGLATAFITTVHDWFDRAHGRQRTVAMIEDGHAASVRVAQKLGYAEYRTAQLPGSETVMRLYERI